MSNAADSKKWAPPAMRTPEDTGLNMGILTDLALKTIYFAGQISGQEIANRMCLPFTGVVEPIIEFMKREKWVEVRGQSSNIGAGGVQYLIGEKGSVKAREVIERSMYAGACPVTLAQYVYAMKAQARVRHYVTQETIDSALGGYEFDQEVKDRIGPAVNSGKAVFMHGPPGNGKTTLASKVGRTVLGQDIWIPYAIDVDGQVIRIFDSVNHEVLETVDSADERAATGVRRDPRWVRIRRPMIMVGGELTMSMLDLVYDPINKFYEAPYQMKSNGGLFFIDDFGRQQMRPQDLLNRWIVPLESRVDFLTLSTGRKIEIPFNVLIFFSTNLDPKQLVDEAFLRRIPYKIHIGDPTWDQFRKIFMIMAEQKKIPFDPQGLAYLVQEWYIKKDRPPRAVHPRDILDALMDMARYMNKPPRMSKELLDHAASSYFVDLGQYRAVTRD